MLPRLLTLFIGRLAETRELRASLDDRPLTTLVGPPGVGKTRLALETASGLESAFGERRWFIDLAPVTAPELVASTVRASVDAPARDSDAVADVVRYIGAESALLVLDNCEHQLEAVSSLCLALLARCEQLRIVTTSRTELGVAGEHVLVVKPLSTESNRHRQSEAVQLFYDRAELRGAELRRDAAEAELVSKICARLDGLPLAIELAAARARSVSLAELLERLIEPLEMLSAEPGQSALGGRSLADSIASSFHACGEPEQLGLAALSVFGGSFDLPAVQSVLEAVGAPGVIEVIDTLVSRSLLHTVSDADGRVRYRMLVVVRAFARDQLQRRPEQEERAREAHARWYARIGAALETTWVGPGQAAKLRDAELDLSNIREAAAWAIEHGRTEHLLGLVLLPTAELWWATGRLEEGLYWLRRTLDQPGLDGQSRFRALMLGATIAYGLRLQGEGDRYLAELSGVMDGVRDPYARGAYAYAQGFGEIQRGEPERAIATLTGARDLGDADPLLIRLSLRSRQLLVYAENLLGDDRAATRTCREILNLTEHTEDIYFASFAHQMLALYSWRRGARGAAYRHARSALRACREFPNRPENIDLLITCALLEERWGEPRRAGILLAAAGKVDSIGLRPATATAHDVEAAVAVIAGRTAESPHATGPALTAHEAIAFALGPSGSPSTTGAISLTRRETEVAHLIREGLANKQIAKTLGLSTKTVEGHIARLMAKIGASSRVQIAMWTPEREG